MRRKFLAALGVLSVLASCANPKVIERKNISDERLSCSELQSEIVRVDLYREQALKETGVTGTNTAAVLFFWPALLVTHSNVKEAVAAADARKDYLMSLYSSKNCKNN